MNQTNNQAASVVSDDSNSVGTVRLGSKMGDVRYPLLTPAEYAALSPINREDMATARGTEEQQEGRE
jgi:hypothetical protein